MPSRSGGVACRKRGVPRQSEGVACRRGAWLAKKRLNQIEGISPRDDPQSYGFSYNGTSEHGHQTITLTLFRLLKSAKLGKASSPPGGAVELANGSCGANGSWPPNGSLSLNGSSEKASLPNGLSVLGLLRYRAGLGDVGRPGGLGLGARFVAGLARPLPNAGLGARFIMGLLGGRGGAGLLARGCVAGLDRGDSGVGLGPVLGRGGAGRGGAFFFTLGGRAGAPFFKRADG